MRARSFALATVTLAMGAALPTAAAAAAPSLAATAQDQHVEQVQLALTPRDEAGLKALAKRSASLPAAARQVRLREVLAGPDRAAEVASRAGALGLNVLSSNDTSVVVAGPAPLVQGLFGSARAQQPQARTASPLPVIPPSLSGLVLSAAGGDETRPAKLPLNTGGDGTLSQSELRSVYDIPNLGSASPNRLSASIATLQFSSWHASDLTKYVQLKHIYASPSYDPVAAGNFTAINVDGGAVDSSGTPDLSGQSEVAVDQQALATAAPSLRQVAYFAPNGDALSQADMLNRVALDAPSRKILAVSTSWGLCETQSYPANDSGAQLRQADENAVLAALAAGVTVFAVSGDYGSADCTDANGDSLGQTSVDAPASLPGVVSVGGTTVNTDGTTTTQTGWNTNEGSSGGGYSTMFCGSAAQAPALPTDSPACAAGSGKAKGLPDIALDGDPNTGLDVYMQEAGGFVPVGGTSLGGPLAAAGLGTILAKNGYGAGVGDITPWLYASQGTSAFTDIVSGNNGAYSAGPGWDPMTGLGSPHWFAQSTRSLLNVANGYVAPQATSVPITVTLPTANTFTHFLTKPYAATLSDCPISSGSSNAPASVPISTSSTGYSLLAVDSTNHCLLLVRPVARDRVAPVASVHWALDAGRRSATASWTTSDVGMGVNYVHFSVVVDGKYVHAVGNSRSSSLTVSYVAGHTYMVTIAPIDYAGNLGRGAVAVASSTSPPSTTASWQISSDRTSAIASWTSNSFGPGVNYVHVNVLVDGRYVHFDGNSRASSMTFPVATGHTYILTVRAVDYAGKVGPAATATAHI